VRQGRILDAVAGLKEGEATKSGGGFITC
jgi:hypothetical protein